MIRILIVDDEHTIRNGLERSIPWKEHGFVVVGTAKNGLDALDFFTNNYADIVISDIKMPRMDGLELQKILKQKYPDLPFIFISGYEDFAFAREALRHGAFSYLLKPLDPTELLSDLKRACQTFHLSTENIPLKQVIERNFYGFEQNWDFTNYEYLESECNHNYFCVINIRCRMDDMRSQIFLMNFQQKIQHIVASCFTSDNSVLLESSSHGIIFCVMNTSSDILKYNINTFVNTINSKLTEYSTTPLGIWTGSVYKGISKLLDSYVESFENNSFKYFNQEKEASDNLFAFDTYSLLFEKEDDIIAALYQGNLEEAIALLEKQREFSTSHKLHADDTRLYLRHLLHKYLTAVKLANPTLTLPDTIHAYGVFSLMTIPEMYEKLYESLKNIATYLKPVTIKSSTQHIEKTKNYVEMHFSDPYLSLSTLAENIGLNPSYLSAEFTKKEGIGLSNYITEIRMKKALFLLKNTDMNVTEISKATGYLNPTYFSTIFKRSVNQTPSQYRKSLL